MKHAVGAIGGCLDGGLWFAVQMSWCRLESLEAFSLIGTGAGIGETSSTQFFIQISLAHLSATDRREEEAAHCECEPL